MLLLYQKGLGIYYIVMNQTAGKQWVAKFDYCKRIREETPFLKNHRSHPPPYYYGVTVYMKFVHTSHTQ